MGTDFYLYFLKLSNNYNIKLDNMACKYAFYLPAFLIVLIHLIVFHPVIKDRMEKLIPMFKSISTAIMCTVSRVLGFHKGNKEERMKNNEPEGIKV